MSAPDDDGVGYKKPPKASQFKPGQSGNPNGRKKGSRGLKTDLKAELESRMTIRINGEPVTETRQRLLMRALASRAATGDVRAIAIIMPLAMQILGIEDRGTDRHQLSRLDQAILDELLGPQPDEGGGQEGPLSQAESDQGGSTDGKGEPSAFDDDHEPEKVDA